jgi:hypothetical protein
MADQEEQLTALEHEVEECVATLLEKGDEFVQLLRNRLQEVAPKRRSIRSAPMKKRARRAV